MKRELIEKLKTNEKPYCFCTPEEQAIFDALEKKGQLQMRGLTSWYAPSYGACSVNNFRNYAWRVKPDYTPEPEFVRVEIELADDNTFFVDHKEFVRNDIDCCWDTVSVTALPRMKGFVGFEYTEHEGYFYGNHYGVYVEGISRDKPCIHRFRAIAELKAGTVTPVTAKWAWFKKED